MRTTQELYGIDPEEFKDLPYHEALEYKKVAAEKHLRHLVYDKNLTYTDIVNEVSDAIKHNEVLINEIKEKKKKEIK